MGRLLRLHPDTWALTHTMPRRWGGNIFYCNAFLGGMLQQPEGVALNLVAPTLQK